MSAAVPDPMGQWQSTLARRYILFGFGFCVLIGSLATLEVFGVARDWIGYIFLFATVVMYAAIGIFCRTSDPLEYYVAGRRVPAVFNGMATAADWMSVASFIGVAGTLYLAGFDALAFILGWTGGYVLLALLIAPYLRRFGRYTITDFLGARYGGYSVRVMAVVCTLACSFSYLVAQIYGVGLITTRLTGLSFELGVFIALGSMLVCSFLGGMRAVTWTQVAQYIILVIAYLLLVVWLSVSQTGKVLPQLAAGEVLSQVAERQAQIAADPAEIALREHWIKQSDLKQLHINGLPLSWQTEREAVRSRLIRAREAQASSTQVRQLERELARYPESEELARERWALERDVYRERAQALEPFLEPFGALTDEQRRARQNNFFALLICLMLGTAGLPHILMRSLTTPTVSAARHSVFWSLLFILALYLMAPALAVLVKNEIYQSVVGLSFDELPEWISSWAAMDRSLVDLRDINGDGIVQLGELHLGADMVVLAGPEIGGLPFVMTGLIAAGAMAAALSTADGLLLTLSNALSHDISKQQALPQASHHRQVILSKVLLLFVAFMAAWVATRTPADIIFMVTAAFSFAAASFFPALVLGVFWQRTNRWGAIFGMLSGLLVTGYYMASTQPWLRELVFGVSRSAPIDLWWGVQPIAAGIFGAPVAFGVMILVSLATPKPDASIVALVTRLRQAQ
jgi:cation/acetate symporter